MEYLNRNSKKLFKIVLTLIAGSVLIFLAAWVISARVQYAKDRTVTNSVIQSIKPIRENNFNYTYIFPLLSYDFTKANQFLRNESLNKKIDDYVGINLANKNAQKISVYVRNLSDNHWSGVNEDDKFHPGSLLKVLIMMAYFRQAEMNPNILNANFTYTKTIAQQTTSLDFSAPSSLEIGQQYSVTQLIKTMIDASDNGAETLLLNNIDRQMLNNAYTDLSIPNPDTVTGDYTISPRQYSAFLRILYNSTYLSEIYSEQALSIMAQSQYRAGISAGIPQSVSIAQKYGERVNETNGSIQTVELHDCGVVYAVNHPYTVCVMTKGEDIQKLTQIIKDVSALVYKSLTEDPQN